MLDIGIHEGIPFETYIADPAVSRSDLAWMLVAPAKARYAKDHPDPHTVATAVGDCIHCAVLTPDLFEERFAIPPDVPRRSNADKATWALWREQHPNSIELKREDWDLARECGRIVEADRLASGILRGPGRNELTAVWEDRGVRCKGRVDRATRWRGISTLVDVKSCRDASPRGFAKACAEYGYHRQAAWYLRGMNILSPRERRFVFVAVEKEPPFLVGVYELSEGALAQGADENKRALAAWSECTASGFWPGYVTDVEPLDLPKWAQRFFVEEEIA